MAGVDGNHLAQQLLRFGQLVLALVQHRQLVFDLDRFGQFGLGRPKASDGVFRAARIAQDLRGGHHPERLLFVIGRVGRIDDRDGLIDPALARADHGLVHA